MVFLLTEIRQQAREGKEGNEQRPCLQPTPIGMQTEAGVEHAKARTILQCAEQLKAALTLALNSAPTACWNKTDQAGRQPLHHLLENPIRHSCSLGALLVAELERRLAMLDAQTASCAPVF